MKSIEHPQKRRALCWKQWKSATQNPGEQLGVFGLPESQLDRFLLGISLGYPDPEHERVLLAGGDTRENATKHDALLDQKTLKHWTESVAATHMSDSPRAALSLVRASRAMAFVQGRDHVLPDDVKAVFPAVAGHRLTGSVAAGEKVANTILNNVTAP